MPPVHPPVDQDDRDQDQRDRQQMWQGFGDGLAQAVEMAVVPVVFTLLGVFLDGRLGTKPWLAVGLAVFAMVGTFVKAFYVYRHQSQQEEVRRPWVRQQSPPPQPR